MYVVMTLPTVIIANTVKEAAMPPPRFPTNVMVSPPPHVYLSLFYPKWGTAYGYKKQARSNLFLGTFSRDMYLP
jgi:hypothetical protein